MTLHLGFTGIRTSAYWNKFQHIKITVDKYTIIHTLYKISVKKQPLLIKIDFV